MVVQAVAEAYRKKEDDINTSTTESTTMDDNNRTPERKKKANNVPSPNPSSKKSIEEGSNEVAETKRGYYSSLLQNRLR